MIHDNNVQDKFGDNNESLSLTSRAVNEPKEYEQSFVHIRSFDFSQKNKRTRTLKWTNFLVHIRLLRKLVVQVRVCSFIKTLNAR